MSRTLDSRTVPSALPGGHYRVELIADRYCKDDRWIEIYGHKPGRRYSLVASFSVRSAGLIAGLIREVLEANEC